MKKKFIVVKTFKVKGLGKWFGCFWFFNHSLKWFLVAPPKDWFAQYHNQQPCGQGDFNQGKQNKQLSFIIWWFHLIFPNVVYTISFSFSPFYCLKRNMKVCDPKVSSLSFFYFFVLLGCLRICLPFNMTFITFVKLVKSSSNSWWPSKY